MLIRDRQCNSVKVQFSVLNVKAIVAAFNPEKAQVEAFSMIVKSLRTFVGSSGGDRDTPEPATRLNRLRGAAIAQCDPPKLRCDWPVVT